MSLQAVLPDSWTVTDGRASVGGVDLAALADHVDTPAYVVDVGHVRRRLDRFAEAMDGIGRPVYAAKAFLCTAMAELMAADPRWWVDVVSGGEAAVAQHGGLPASRLLMHGNVKTDAELEMAVDGEVGLCVLDSLDELDRLDRLADAAGTTVDVMLRLNEDVELSTHPKILTSGEEAKFGLMAGQAAEAAARLTATPNLRLRGVHLHIGSQIRDAELYAVVLERVVEFAEQHLESFAAGPILLDVGGGMAAPYLRSESSVDPMAIGEVLRSASARFRIEDRLGETELLIEPGRAVIANAVVTLYRVGARKPLPLGGELVAVDGGMTDNPRPSLYGSKHEILAVTRMDEPHDHPVRLFGRMCETDVLLETVGVPAGLAAGDVMAMAATGAYTYSMSSRYNLLARPPVVFVEGGEARVVVERERLEHIVAGDYPAGEAATWTYNPGDQGA